MYMYVHKKRKYTRNEKMRNVNRKFDQKLS